MAKANYIASFPEDIDREGFGNWLSGFVDGEGSFDLESQTQVDRVRQSYHARLHITVRDDDAATLQLIQSFWGCGRITFWDNSRNRVANANPVAKYSVQKTSDLVNIILPHFDRFPLRAKKRRDFEIWKQGVLIKFAVMDRPRRFQAGTSIGCKWTDAERMEFQSLAITLRSQRKYSGRQMSSPQVIPVNPIDLPGDRHPRLFV